MKENLMETFKQGLFLGMLLFICSLTALRLAAPEGVGPVWSLFPAVLSGYLAAGCFLQLIRSLAARLDSAFFEKPGSSEEFFTALETYCKKSSITLEYVKRDIPATVKLNGRLHTVTLTESYMYGGPGWSMEIQEIL